MDRHSFDPVTFVLGSLALAAGLIVLGGGELIGNARVLVPLGLIAFGLAVLVKLSGRARHRED
ncbi:MAG TPA: hypothetical protein VH479_12775 [Acidimicrobiales bacterium]